MIALVRRRLFASALLLLLVLVVLLLLPVIALAPALVVRPTGWTFAAVAAGVLVAWLLIASRPLRERPPRVGAAVGGWLAAEMATKHASGAEIDAMETINKLIARSDGDPPRVEKD